MGSQGLDWRTESGPSCEAGASKQDLRAARKIPFS
jgi:hypothetical protein